MTQRKLFIAVAASALLVLSAAAGAQAAEIVYDDADSPHFVICYNRADYHGGNVPPGQEALLQNKVTPEVLGNLKEWLEKSYQVEVVQHRFREPLTSKLAGKFRVHLYDFGADSTALGRVSRSNGIVQLNLRVFHRKGNRPYNQGKLLMPATVCHELFHAIQLAYDRQEERWLMEATAQWMEPVVFPDLHDVVGHERVYLVYPFHSLHFPRTGTANDLGRPYGGSVFFRFLTRHHPDGAGIVRKVFQECAATEGANSLDAVVKPVNARRRGDFRRYFDRFAVGCLLRTQAPAQYKLADAEMLRTAKFTNLSASWRDYYANRFRDPRSVSLLLRFNGADQPNRLEDGQACGLGTRYFKVSAPANLPEDSTLFVLVRAPQRELSVQGMVKHDGQWKVFKAVYNAASTSHVLRIPRVDSQQAASFVAVTRYLTNRDGKAYPMKLCVADPPVLSEVTVRQKQRPVLQIEWTDVRLNGGLMQKRVRRTQAATGLKPSDGEAEIVLAFSQPVRAGDKPMCLLNGAHPVDLRSGAGGKVWTGSITEQRLRDTARALSPAH